MSQYAATEHQRFAKERIVRDESLVALLRDYEQSWQSLWKLESLLESTMDCDTRLHVRLDRLVDVIKKRLKIQ